MNLEIAIERLILDWRSRKSPSTTSETYLAQLIAHNTYLKAALELETELKVYNAEKLLRRK